MTVFILNKEQWSSVALAPNVRNLFLNGERVKGRMQAHAIVELTENVVFE